MNVKKRMMYERERETYRKNLQSITDNIDGYIISINNLDMRTSLLRSNIRKFIIDINSKYSFFSRKTVKLSNQIMSMIKNPNPNNDVWDSLNDNLIKLKNQIQREI